MQRASKLADATDEQTEAEKLKWMCRQW